MFQIDVAPFFRAVTALARLETLVSRIRETGGKDEPLIPAHINIIRDLIVPVRGGLSSFGAVMTGKSLDRFAWLIEQPGVTSFQTEAPLKELNQRLLDEVSISRVFALRNVTAHLYRAPDCLFGEAVERAYPSALEDVRDAGNCLALEQGTACVFHLMRVMEVGLRALGKRLGIPYAPSWESYIKQIDANIAAKRRVKGIAWRRDEKFFRDLNGDLLTVKHAWRNPTMHIERAYSHDEAMPIFLAVRSFMERLAAKIGEAD